VNDEITCREFTELVTEYLEGAMSPEARTRFEAHMDECEGCTTYMDQMRVMLRTLVRTHAELAPRELREELVESFRSWRAGT
jgi:anti-sigma factor (TIGR02949 family)